MPSSSVFQTLVAAMLHTGVTLQPGAKPLSNGTIRLSHAFSCAAYAGKATVSLLSASCHTGRVSGFVMPAHQQDWFITLATLATPTIQPDPLAAAHNASQGRHVCGGKLPPAICNIDWVQAGQLMTSVTGPTLRPTYSQPRAFC
jgi:hypothetical protein